MFCGRVCVPVEVLVVDKILFLEVFGKNRYKCVLCGMYIFNM